MFLVVRQFLLSKRRLVGCQNLRRVSWQSSCLCSFSVPINGGWTDWGKWSMCSKTCETGSQSRDRSCTNPAPAFGGESCVGPSVENKVCKAAKICLSKCYFPWSIVLLAKLLHQPRPQGPPSPTTNVMSSLLLIDVIYHPPPSEPIGRLKNRGKAWAYFRWLELFIYIFVVPQI